MITYIIAVTFKDSTVPRNFTVLNHWQEGHLICLLLEGGDVIAFPMHHIFSLSYALSV